MRWLLAALLLATPAAAQVALGEYTAFETRYGRLEVAPASYGQQLLLRGAPVADVTDWRVTILGAWAIGGEDWDWALVEIAHNGNMCPARLVILRVSAGALARTGEFAECLGRIENVAVTPGRIAVRVHDPAVEVEAQEFVYDGASFTVSKLAASTARAAGPGADVLRWSGRFFQEVVEDPSERARFQTILTAAQLEELRRRVVVGGVGARYGDWVAGAGCMAHQCNVHAGLWAIRVSDGQPAAAFFDGDGRETWYGVDPRGGGAGDLLTLAGEARLR